MCRLRSFVKYDEPLTTVLDSFFELYRDWMTSREDLTHKTYNVSWNYKRPIRDLDNIRDSDVIVIATDSEFRYWLKDVMMHPLDLAKSQQHIYDMREYVDGKDVILLRSDRGDDKELYINKTFEGCNLKSLNVIDEIDFPANIHGMKYHFIQRLKNPFISRGDIDTDFGYWGNMKVKDVDGKPTGDERHIVIKKIYRDKTISQVLIGTYGSGIVRDNKWIKDWSLLYRHIKRSRTTICFNWINLTATTARYPEALSVGIVPFVWKNYDINNTYNLIDYQRVYSFSEYKERMKELRDPVEFNKRLKEVTDNYLDILPSIVDYKKLFRQRMNEIVNGL